MASRTIAVCSTPPPIAALLDGFGGLNGDAQTVALLHGEWAAARAALEELKALAERAQAEADFVARRRQ